MKFLTDEQEQWLKDMNSDYEREECRQSWFLDAVRKRVPALLASEAWDAAQACALFVMMETHKPISPLPYTRSYTDWRDGR